MTKKKKKTSSRKRPIAIGIYNGAELAGVSICSEGRVWWDSYRDACVLVDGIKHIEQLRDELDVLIRRHRGT